MDLTFHALISQVLVEDDSIDVGRLGVVMPVYDLYLDERVELHRIIQKSRTWGHVVHSSLDEA